MKSRVYRQLITILRALIITALLFEKNNVGLVLAQPDHLTASTPISLNASIGNEGEFNPEFSSSSISSDAVIYRFPVKNGHISVRGQNGSASHEGGAIDIVATDWKVLAAADGYVFESHYNSQVTCKSYDGYKTWYYPPNHPKAGQRCPFSEANYVRILHRNGEITNYFHLDWRDFPEKLKQLGEGVWVAEGEYIGKMGNTGWSDGAHLHFFVQKRPHTTYFRETTYQATLYSGNVAYPISQLKGNGTNKDYFPVCPGFNDMVILYKGQNFGCGGLGKGKGYFLMYKWELPRDITVMQDIEFNPKSVSFPNPTSASQSIDSNKAYLIRTLLSSNYVVDANTDPTGKSLKPVIQWWWHGLNNQRWKFISSGDNTFFIQSLYTGQCLGVENFGEGNKAILTSCVGEIVKWKLEQDLADSTSYYIRHILSNKVLTASSDSQGTALSVTSQGSDNLAQKWHLCEINQIKLELKYQSGEVKKMLTSGDIPNPESTTSIYITGNECPTINGLSAQATGCTPNLPPNHPLLISPRQGYGNTYEPPSLVWASGGDPDDSQLDFQVEVFSDNSAIYSGWIRGTAWLPRELSRIYGTYRWRVKARDPLLAESSWSETRTFTIEAPNKPPSISFSSANGDTFPNGVIYTRNRNWTFTGTASDPEGQLNRVEWRCSGDGCVNSQAIASGAGVWLYTQNGMAGRNDVYFMAYDGYGNNTPSCHLDLRIDLAAPTTTASLNGQSNAAQWPLWFTGPVNVKLHGADNGSGRALVGMGKVHYRLDNAAWQVISASDAAFTVSADGSHTVQYYSEDALGNTEAARSFSFQVDQTPPTLPANLQETHGLVNNQWQKDQNVPAFTWDAATDATSGLRGYQLYFGGDPNGVGYHNILPSAPRQWTPFPAGLPTGTSYLRVRTQDNALNWSAWATLFTFRYDGTPPENPSDVTYAAGITGAWQNTTTLANFSWPASHDEGSGIQGYYVYWGGQADGTSATFITANAYQNLAPLCAANAACIGSLRLRSLDNVGNLAEGWNTAFVLRYDNLPPLVDFSFNGGVTQTAQSQVRLDVTASDPATVSGEAASGVYAARFSADGQSWTDWEQPSAARLWNIPAISRQSWPVYAQVMDGVGLLSAVAQHDVYLDVNPARPSSVNYQLFDHSLSGGSGAYTSANYSGRGALGPVTDSPLASSSHYSLSNGYQAGSQAIPLVVPGHDSYTFLFGVFGSGVVAPALQSASYQAVLTSGGIGLPVTTTLSSASYRYQPGFLAGAQPMQPTELPPTDQPDMPSPDPKPAPVCDAPSLSINAGKDYTDSPNVSLSLCAPYAVEMMLSSNADFGEAAWEPFAPSRSWIIPAAGSSVDAQFVYAQFRDANGNVQATYFDDILYDPNQPGGALLLSDDISASDLGQMGALSVDNGPAALEAASDGSVTLYVDGSDDNSGVTEMQLSPDPAFTGAAWQPFSPLAHYTPEGDDGSKTVYARFQDEAGNISGATAINFVYDTQPPTGYIYADPAVLPGDAVAATLHLGDYSLADEGDEGIPPTDPGFDGGALEMRLGSDPALPNAYWQPLADTVAVAVDPTQAQGAFYVQYRDAAGNLSDVYDTTYQIDTLAPELSAVAEPGVGNIRNLNIYVNDNLSGIASLYLSNDPLMQQDVVTLPYTETFSWTFDDHKVVWIAAEDGVGNRTQPYPVYATEKTISISGNAGTADATLNYTDGSLRTVTADVNGIYLFTVPYNWSGTVTPSKPGFRFLPANWVYENLVADQANQNYAAAPLITPTITITPAITLTPTVTPVPTLLDSNSYNITYQGWSGKKDAKASGGGYRVGNASGQTIVYTATVNSTSISLVTFKGPDQGKVQILVDGVSKGIFDLYSKSPTYKNTITISKLANKKHAITVKVLRQKNALSKGYWVRVDAIKIGSTTIDDGNLAVKYSGWSGASQAGTSNGSYRSSNVTGANATFTITGTQFTLITARGPKYGMVDVYVDNVLFATYDLYNPTQEWQYNLSVSGLGNSAHTIKILVKGARNPASTANTVVLDASIDP